MQLKILKTNDLFWYTLSNIIGKMILGLSGIFLARFFSKLDYAIYATATAFVGLIYIFAQFGTIDYGFFEFSKDMYNSDKILANISYIFMVFYTVGLTSILFYDFIYGSGVVIAFLLYIRYFFEWIFGVITIKLQSKNLFPKLSRMILLKSLSIAIPLLLILIFNLNLNHYILLYVLLTVLIVNIFVYFNSNILISNFLDFKHNLYYEKYVCSQLKPFFVSGMMSYVYMQSDILMISMMAGTAAVGGYAAMVALIFGLYLIPVSFHNYYLPKITSKYHEGLEKELTSLIKEFRNLVLFSMTPISLIMFFGSEHLINLIYGSKYIESSNILTIMSLVLLIHSFSVVYGALITASGNQKIRSRIQSAVALLNIVLNIFIIPIYGPMGAAMTTFLSEIILFIGYFFSGIKLIRK
uniref:Polysaccharide biosynthesis protein n=1 Tax=Methanococcus maripaludis (strain C6 / ATCC BAA-1332) TaxID=444158 RepID=A9A6X7_METM6